MKSSHVYNGPYRGEHLNHVAFPLGGIGAGMVALEGTGALSHVSLRHKPAVFHEPMMFAALHTRAAGRAAAQVLEGPVPMRKAFGVAGAGNGQRGRTYGLPRFDEAEFEARFPFATVRLRDGEMPVQVEITGWSPFEPGDADGASLPVAALEYRLVNRRRQPVRGVFSFHAQNFMEMGKTGSAVRAADGGFVLHQDATPAEPHAGGDFAVTVADAGARVDCRWFRGGWFDPLTVVWQRVATGDAEAHPPYEDDDPSPGGSVYVPFTLKPGASRTIVVNLAWYVPRSDVRVGGDSAPAPVDEAARAALPRYEPWYAGRFDGIAAVLAYWREQAAGLRAHAAAFRDCLYDTTLPPEVMEAVAANLTILKSPTVLRQKDGRFWGWEGCCDGSGCCHGSCTHVWNYAQALPHLFPALERSLRETEFEVCQDERGHQNFRAPLPIRAPDHGFHAAADGQLGGLMKLYREWRIGGDEAWLRRLWPRARQSLLYAIETWDPDHRGALVEPHHNTYDIEFWGPDGMCTSFYLGALQAAIAMGTEMGDDVALFRDLYAKGRAFMEAELWNGEYFVQKVQWQGLHAPDPTQAQTMGRGYSAEARELLAKEGPKYQYGDGCLADGVLGAWLAAVSGLDEVLEADKVKRHLAAVARHNFRANLSRHANPQRPTYALGREGGLLLCTWPRGGALTLPFVYSNEVWTGIEYQVASHLMLTGQAAPALRIVRAARDRYDGRVRNPFNEYECGHWYARAMASYGMLQGLSGARYDAVTKTLHLAPRVKGDFRAFFATAGGYGTVGVRKGRPFLDVRHGTINVGRLVYCPAGGPRAARPAVQRRRR